MYMNLTPTHTHRWQKCARKALGTHDWICKLALSSEFVRTTVLGRKNVMQLKIWIRYNRLKKCLTLIYASLLYDVTVDIFKLNMCRISVCYHSGLVITISL